ncbi:MAG: HAD-IA family hydrolase [Beijerinckiaceae bacterium]|nr:HAD-IA family hydrolase [Beijerinckiaceae bacterium]MCI0736551.1 HAD-IA family hydrolase [Beijerinckiaceae bacterium]
MPLKALIFDVDGTLAETEEAHRRSFNEAFAAAGLDWTWDKELYRKLLQVTGGKERLLHYIKEWNPPGSAAALSRFTKIYSEASDRYARLVESGAAPPRLGVRRLITEAYQRGVLLGIATTSLRYSVITLLRAMLGKDGPSWFTVIAAGDAVPNKKPSPDIYFLALEGLGLGAESCAAIEDSENGIRAARAAGLSVIATPSYYLRGDDFSLATSVLSDLGEPGRPLRQLGGLSFGRPYADVDGLTAWLSKQQPSRAGALADSPRAIKSFTQIG